MAALEFYGYSKLPLRYLYSFTSKLNNVSGHTFEVYLASSFSGMTLQDQDQHAEQVAAGSKEDVNQTTVPSGDSPIFNAPGEIQLAMMQTLDPVEAA